MTANMEAIQTVEDITYRNDMTVEEIATKMGELLRKSIVSDYHRGGLRRKYD